MFGEIFENALELVEESKVTFYCVDTLDIGVYQVSFNLQTMSIN